MPIIAIALLLAAALGGGTAFAAQSSLPGDTLWGFKTTVNEGLQGALAGTDKAKAEWDINAAAGRLTEAQTLKATGKLNASAQADISANFDAHAKEAAALIAKLETQGKTSDAADVAAHFQAMIAQNAADLNADSNAQVQADIAPLLSHVRATLDEATNLSASASAQAEARDMAQTDTVGDSGNASSSNEGSSVQVHTGTSVKGGQGGIQTTEDGSVIGI